MRNKKCLLLILCTLGVLCGEFFGCAKSRPTAEQVAAGGELVRPVVVIGGYGDFGIGDRTATGKLRRLTGDPRIRAVHPGFSGNFSDAADAVVNAVDESFGAGSDTETIEVDVVAISMGGLTARWAAAPDAQFGDNNRRLKIKNLYTIASPHIGAQMADNWAWADPFFTGRSMRTGSDFYTALAAREAVATGDERYPIVQYARENDITIGPGSDLPPHLWDRGQVIWLDMPFWRTGHAGAYGDERILRDITRRLETEQLTTENTEGTEKDVVICESGCGSEL